MAHMRIAVYQFNPGVTVADTVRAAREVSLPTYQQQPGFVAYEAIHAGGDTWISITTWESKEQADAAAERIAAVVRENPEMVRLVRSREHQWIGDLVFSSREP